MVAALHTAYADHAAVAVGSVMYVLGGFDGGTFSASVHKFDSAQGIWSEVAPMPHTRVAHSACVFGSDIYVFGGCNDRFRSVDNVYKYDTERDAWTILTSMPVVGDYLGVAALGDQIYLTGVGNSGKEVLLLDPASGVWVNLAPTLRNRQKGSLFVLDGCVHAAGGYGNHTSVERYDAGTDTWTAAADMLEVRMLSVTVTIPAAGPAEEQNLFDALIANATR
jgi:hypothetical protein